MQNSKIRCIFLDDDKGTLEIISNAVAAIFKSNGYVLEARLYSDPKAFLMEIEDFYPDLIFADIEMPGLDGIEAMKKMKDLSINATVIFVSNREDRVFDSLSIHPFGFIRKKNFLTDASTVVGRYLEERVPAQSTILIKTDDGLVSLKIEDILYIESVKKHQVFHLENGEKPRTRTTLEEINKSLLPQVFLVSFKGITVNYRAVKTIGKDTITLITGEKIPLSKRKGKQFKEEYLALAADDNPIKIHH